MASEVPRTRDAMGRTAREATPGALRTAMCGPPIQNRDRISAPPCVDKLSALDARSVKSWGRLLGPDGHAER